MNISHDGGSIVRCTTPWASRNEPDPAIDRRDPAWLDYCRAREIAERAAAKKASSEVARRVHQELAQAYAAAVEKRGE